MPQPLYRQVAEALRQKITSGDVPPGAQLPSEPELEKRYGVSRNTVRLALTALANEGLVESRQGRGTFVRDRITFTVLASAEEGGSAGHGKDAFVAAVTVHGRKAEQVDFRMEVRTASPEVAARLQVDEGSLVVVRRMRRLIDGRPWSIQESFYPMDVAEGTRLMSPTDISYGTITEMARHGHTQVGYRDEVLSRMPTHTEAAFLGVGTGVPVLEMFRTAYSTERAIRLTINVYAGDSTQLAYEIGDVVAGQEAAQSTEAS
ncbi:GntR family transcriptional regulator [Microtetraspora malaysiensis]|uniref:GntR family transcriptional regulator n=1 Tax=Microtetraspora malaysiensis TaxID=161358 RepID=UPI0008351032|nr:GntR family transcriptional regulator [Microtetraspora malaysiensis]